MRSAITLSLLAASFAFLILVPNGVIFLMLGIVFSLLMLVGAVDYFSGTNRQGLAFSIAVLGSIVWVIGVAVRLLP